ncbi:MAG: hypothetical protein ACEY26_00905 [Candidatus Hodgkinia cicadicola]
MLPSLGGEGVALMINFRLSDRLKAVGVPFVRWTEWGTLVLACKGKRQEARHCVHFWFKTNRPTASLEVIRSVCRGAKALKWAFYKTDCYNANVKLQFPIGQFDRKSLS